MIDISEDIHSLSDFKRNTTEFIRRLKETARPVVLTINGKADLVVQDAAAYQKLLELLDRFEAIEGIQRGLKSLRRGKGRRLEEAIEALREKLQDPNRWMSYQVIILPDAERDLEEAYRLRRRMSTLRKRSASSFMESALAGIDFFFRLSAIPSISFIFAMRRAIP